MVSTMGSMIGKLSSTMPVQSRNIPSTNTRNSIRISAPTVPPGIASTNSLITVMPPPRENTPVKAVAPTNTSMTMVVVLPASIIVQKQVLILRSPKIKNRMNAINTPMAEASVGVKAPA